MLVESSKTKCYVRSTRVANREFEGLTLAITSSDSRLHRFNDVGTVIWRLLEQPATPAAICEEVRREFAIPEGTDAAGDIQRFLDKLVTADMVVIVLSDDVS